MQETHFSDTVRPQADEHASGSTLGLVVSELKHAAKAGMLTNVEVTENKGIYQVGGTMFGGPRARSFVLVKARSGAVREFKKPFTYAKLLKDAGINEWTTRFTQ